MKWLAFGFAGLLAAAAVAAILLGTRACDARDPTSVVWSGQRYTIRSRSAGESAYVELERGGRVVQSLAGSLDLWCDPPFSALFDVDGDGQTDLYFEHCRGHGYVAPRAGELTYVDLGDRPRPDGWWARQVLDGGSRLLAIGVGLALLALVTLAVAGATLRPTAR